MTYEDEGLKGVFTMKDVTNKILEDPEFRATVFRQGVEAMLLLLEGRELWERIPPLAMTEETALKARGSVESMPAGVSSKSSYSDSMFFLAHTALHLMMDEFTQWAEENHRGDLLADAVDVINAALPSNERIVKP